MFHPALLVCYFCLPGSLYSLFDTIFMGCSLSRLSVWLRSIFRSMRELRHNLRGVSDAYCLPLPSVTSASGWVVQGFWEHSKFITCTASVSDGNNHSQVQYGTIAKSKAIVSSAMVSGIRRSTVVPSVNDNVT